MEERRKRTGETLGILGPKAIVELSITGAKEPEWTPEDYTKLAQDGLFDTEEMRKRVVLRKIPFDFHYRYISGENVQRHKLIDWEVGALYWNCVRRYGADGWETAFRDKLEGEFSKKDLFFLMGTVHRFPDHWLIVGLIYPPKLQPAQGSQQLGLALDQ